MEDGEERNSLTPDSDLTMAGVTLHQLIQEHFSDLLRYLPAKNVENENVILKVDQNPPGMLLQ